MSIEAMIEQMHRAPDPACEVVTLERVIVEQMLNELEHKGPLDPLVTYLRLNLSLPKVELWAMHSVGPGEYYPALNRAHAETMVAGIAEACQAEKQRRIDAGESLEHWFDWVSNVIPSPYEPDEHFEKVAEQALEEEQRMREGWIKSSDDRTKLLDGMALAQSHISWLWDQLEECSRLKRDGSAEVLHQIAQVVTDVTAEEVARAKELAEYKERLAAAGERAIAKINPAEGDKS